MKKLVYQPIDWKKVNTIDPPILTSTEWLLCNLLGVVFLVMAVLQLISFGDFRDILSSMGLYSPTLWGTLIVIAELWAAAGFFRLRLSYLFRVVSGSLALLVSGFWFVAVTQAVASGRDLLPSSGLFGRFFNQSPGWWTVLEVTILVLWTMYGVALTRYTVVMPRRK